MHKTPLFISGIGRSGTSAVISSLSKHKSVVEPNRVGEAPIISHFINFLMEYEDKSPDRDYHLKNYQLDPQGRDEAYSNLLSSLQYGFDVNENQPGKNHWIAKVSLSEAAYKKACKIFSELRVVYVMRNGVEVVNSAKSFHGFASLTFEQLCKRWASSLETCRYLEDSDLCATIKHHELVADPSAVYKDVFEKLRMDQDSSPAEFISTTLFNSSFDKTGSVKSTSGVFNNRLACWNEWTKEEKDTFISICDRHMEEYDFQRPYVDSYKPAATKKAKSKKRPAALNKDSASPKLIKMVKPHMSMTLFDYVANPSEKFSYFFLENPKVASTSILKELQQRQDKAIEKQMPNPHDRFASPIPRLAEMSTEKHHWFLESPDVFRFVFVRNPVSRLLSAYLSKIDQSLQAKAEILAVLQGVDISEIKDLSTPVDFPTFVDVVCSQESLDMNAHWRTQIDQILFGKIDYSFIGRFENLEEDYQYVMQTIFSEKPQVLSQSKNKTGSDQLVSEYYTQDLLDKVYSKFYEDFNAFEYSKTKLLKAVS